MNKQIYSRTEFPAQIKVLSGQPSQQRPETKVMKEHGVMSWFEILAQLTGALPVVNEE